MTIQEQADAILDLACERDGLLARVAQDRKALLGALKGLMELREAHFSPDDYAWESRVQAAYSAIALAERPR